MTADALTLERLALAIGRHLTALRRLREALPAGYEEEVDEVAQAARVLAREEHKAGFLLACSEMGIDRVSALARYDGATKGPTAAERISASGATHPRAEEN